MIAIDVNERARELCAANAAANGITTVDVLEPDAVSDDVRFDLIWSNPPIRIGKPALHELLLRWLGPTDRRWVGGARRAQAPRLRLAAQWLDAQGFPTQRIASSKGYRLLRVRPS